MLGSKDEKVRLAGLIAVDVACFEGFPSRPLALETLNRALGEPGRTTDLDLLLKLARMNPDKSLTPGLQKLLGRSDVPASVTAQALLLLHSRSATVPAGVLAAAGKYLLDAVNKGTIRVNSPAEAALLLEVLEAEGTDPVHAGASAETDVRRPGARPSRGARAGQAVRAEGGHAGGADVEAAVQPEDVERGAAGTAGGP